jgi:chromosome segregation ATPase
MALSPDAKRQVERRIDELQAEVKTHTREAEKASGQLDELRKDEEKKEAKAAELNEKLENARAEWGGVRNELEGKIGEAQRQKGDLERRSGEARDRLADARREWGRALYEEGRDLPALRKAMAPIDENREQQAQLDEELKTAAAERETLRPGVQRFTLIASIATEVLILAVLFVILVVLAL